MIKKAFLIASFVLAVMVLFPLKTLAIRIASPEASIDLQTAKVSFISGSINDTSFRTFLDQTTATLSLPGPRLIFINSGGGDVDSGEKIIRLMNIEKEADGTDTVCVVTGVAASMAFNIFTHCDVRLAFPTASFMFHHMAWGGLDCVTQRCTAPYLHQQAKIIKDLDVPYGDANAKALGLTTKEYDVYARKNYFWKTDELLKRGYLNGVVTLTDN